MSVGARGGGSSRTPGPTPAPSPAPTTPRPRAGQPHDGPNTRDAPTHPGLGPSYGANDVKEYDTWWLDTGFYWSQWMNANPDYAGWIKAKAWEMRGDKNGTIDALLMKGLNPPGSGGSGGSGSRRYGGGGGGGATKDQQYAQAAAAIKNRASALGVKLDEAGIVSLAKVVVDSNWSNDQLDDYLVPAATEPGLITYGVDTIKKMAAQQLLNVSDATAKEWAMKMESGEMTTEGIQSLLQGQAVQKYGWAASQVGQGVSVRDMLLPSRDLIARELELNPEEVDLMDTKWLGMVQTKDDKTGEIRAATDSEVVMRARQDPQWSRTRAAGATMAGVATMIREYFGG